MGIRVEPPDVNVSAVQFSVAGDTVHFGLAAIKNVGAGGDAIHSEVAEREGPVPDARRLLRAVDLRLVNRRVVESLLRRARSTRWGSRARICWRPPTPRSESGGRQQRDRAEGQGSFFELLPEAPARAERPGRCRTRVGGGPASRVREGGARLLHLRAPAGPISRGRRAARRHDLGRPGRQGSRRASSSCSVTPPGSRRRPPRAAIGWPSSRSRTWTAPSRSRCSRSRSRRRRRACARARRCWSAARRRWRQGPSRAPEDVRLLEQALAESAGRPRSGAASAEPSACRIRIAPARTRASPLRPCEGSAASIPGACPCSCTSCSTPGSRRQSRRLSVDGSKELVAEGETALGAGAISVDYAGRA